MDKKNRKKSGLFVAMITRNNGNGRMTKRGKKRLANPYRSWKTEEV